jgi:hypothetical protein
MLFLMMTALAIYPIQRNEFIVAIALMVPAGVGTGIYALRNYYSGSVDVDSARLALQGFTPGYVLDPNYLGGSFLLSIAVALAGVFFVRILWVRIVCGLCVLPMFAGVLVTGSRTAFFASLAIFAYFVLRTKYRVQAMAIAAVGLSLTLLYPRVLVRLTDQSASNGSGRTYIWQTGMHSFADHWLFGSGVGSFAYNYDRNFFQVFQQQFAGWSRPGHSFVFVGLNDYGVVGFALALCCCYASFRQLRAIPKTSWLYGMRVGCEAALVGLLIQSLFIDPYYIKYIWLALSLPLMVANLYAPHVMRVGLQAGSRAAPAPARPSRALRGT